MLIGITGQKFSGKSTVAKMLSEMLGYKVVSFATPLKKMVCALMGCNIEQLEDYDYKENTIVPKHLWVYCSGVKHTVRELLQGLGDLMRAENPYVFVECALNSDSDLIVSDCRMPNEADAIRKQGGIVIRVERDGLQSSDTHSSETAMKEIVPDIIVENNKGLDELRGALGTLVKLWKVMGRV